MRVHVMTQRPTTGLKLMPVHSKRSSVEISALELIKFTWKPWQDAIIFLLTAGFPSIKTLFFFKLTTSTEEMTTKQDEKHCAVACTISWVACLMELAQRVSHVREFEGYRSVAWFGKKAGEIKRNDVAHLLYLYSISSPQTAGPGCRDERLSGGQERRSWVRRKMASRLSNTWKRNPPPLSVLGSGRTYESPVTLDGRLGVRSSLQHSIHRAGCFKADMAPCQIFPAAV